MKSVIEQLKILGDSFDGCMTLVDMSTPEHLCLYVNKHFTEVTGYSSEESIGKNLKFLQGPLSNPTTINFMSTSFDSEKGCCQDIVNYRKDGTPFLNRLVLVPVKVAERSVYVGFQHDITEQRALDYNQEKLSLVSSGEIAHNILNPLAIILAHYELSDRRSEVDLSNLRKEMLSEFIRLNDFILKIEETSLFDDFE